jgi:Dolichyl-phosphate-mannose-protein mannosyltransferase
VLCTVFFFYQLPRLATKSVEIARAHQVFLGVAICLILLTSDGYSGNHGSRTCDYEASLILFSIIGYYCFFLYAQSSQSKLLCCAFVMLGLGILTKSVQVLVPAPFVLVWFVKEKKLTTTLKDKGLYIGILAFLMLGPAYYFLREWAAPGYLEAVWNNDIGGRYATSIENHTESNTYYLRLLFGEQFMPWAVVAALFPVLMYKYPFSQWKQLGWFSLGIGVTYQLIVAFSKTKTGWYGTPSYPYFAVVAAVSLHAIFVHMIARDTGLLFRKLVIFGAISLLPMTIIKIIQLTKRPAQDNEDFGLSKLSQEIYSGIYVPDQKQIYFCAEGYYPHIKFYKKVLEQKGIDIGFVARDALQDHQTIYACRAHIIADLDTTWVSNRQALQHGVVKYELIQKKGQ